MSTKLWQWPGIELHQVGRPNHQMALTVVTGGDPTNLGVNQAVELASALVDWAQQRTHSHALYVAAQYLDQYQAHPEGDPV